MVFFSRLEEREGQYGLTQTGFRTVSENGDFMLPMQIENPGGYEVISLNKNNPKVDTSYNFKSTVRKTKHMIQRTEKVFALNGIVDLEKRNSTILQWIKDHLPELKEQEFWGEPWGSLKEKVFQWLWFSGDDVAAWEALLLKQQLHPDYIKPTMPVDADGIRPFGTDHARDFFYKILTSDSSSITKQVLAIYQLKKSFWAGSINWKEGAGDKNSISHDEQEKYADLLYKLSYHADPQIKEQAVLALAALVNPIEYSDVKPFQNERINGMLIDVYPTIPQGRIRREFNSQLVRVLSEQQWAQLTGNPARMLVSIYQFYYDEIRGQLKFSFRYESGKVLINKTPTVFATQVDDDGNALQTLAFPAIAHYPKKPWNKLDHHRGSISIYLPEGAIGVGKWRFYMEGTAGEGGFLKWKTEVWEMEVE